MNWRANDGLVIGGAAVVLLSVVALSAMWRTEFKDDSLTDWLTVLVSFGGLLMSVVAFIYLKGTFEATKEQADAAKNQVHLAEIANKNTKAIARQNLRPWVVVSGEVVAFHRRRDVTLKYSAKIPEGDEVFSEVTVMPFYAEDELVAQVTLKNEGLSIAQNVIVLLSQPVSGSHLTDNGAVKRSADVSRLDSEKRKLMNFPMAPKQTRIQTISKPYFERPRLGEAQYIFVNVYYEYISADGEVEEFCTAFACRFEEAECSVDDYTVYMT